MTAIMIKAGTNRQASKFIGERLARAILLNIIALARQIMTKANNNSACLWAIFFIPF